MESIESPSIGRLIIPGESISPNMIVNQVADRFFSSSNLDALTLIEDERPKGLVSRPKFFFTLFRRFGFELYGKKPVSTIANITPLIIHRDEKLDTAIDKALGRPQQDVYDEIIVVGDDGRYNGILSVKQMIIEQSNTLANSIVQKEMARERTKELEKINQVKSQFIAHVTHELRSPVNAIIGLAELMKISCEKGAVDQLRDRLSILMSSATNLRAIITNILDLSKIEAGKMEVIRENFDVVKLIREVAEITRVLIGNKPVDVEVVAHDGPVIISSDPVKVRQILINLMSNAAKFTEKGRILLGLTAEKETLKITVSDTGIGIREEDLEKLFTAFSQLEDAKTKSHEGTGLGLTITKNLADLLGGTISVFSSYRDGSRFEVILPYQSQNKEAAYEKEQKQDTGY